MAQAEIDRLRDENAWLRNQLDLSLGEWDETDYRPLFEAADHEESAACSHCVDDPPPGHRCPRCGRVSR